MNEANDILALRRRLAEIEGLSIARPLTPQEKKRQKAHGLPVDAKALTENDDGSFAYTFPNHEQYLLGLPDGGEYAPDLDLNHVARIVVKVLGPGPFGPNYEKWRMFVLELCPSADYEKFTLGDVIETMRASAEAQCCALVRVVDAMGGES